MVLFMGVVKLITPLERYRRLYNGALPTERDPKYLELLRMSKYRLLDMPDQQPGKCANCGASRVDGRKYVDFGLLVDWYGTVHLCSLCIGDIARELGLFSDLEAKIAELLEKSLTPEEAEEKSKELQDRVVKTFKELEEFYVGLSTHRSNSSSDSASNMGSDKGSDGETKSDPVGAKSGTTKSNSSRRSTSVPSLADLLKE